MNTERAIWILTLIFFSPFFFVFLAISSLLIYQGETRITLIGLVKDLVMAAAGTGMGIWWANAKSKQDEERINKESINSLIMTFKKLICLSKKAENDWKGGVPNYPLTNQRIGILCEQVTKFSDPNLRQEIEGFIYQCGHYDSKLIVVNSACLDAILHNSHTDLLALYKKEMSENAGKICEWAKSAREKLEKEKKK